MIEHLVQRKCCSNASSIKTPACPRSAASKRGSAVASMASPSRLNYMKSRRSWRSSLLHQRRRVRALRRDIRGISSIISISALVLLFASFASGNFFHRLSQRFVASLSTFLF
ncbi:hypothetical protein [Salinicola sp. MH3R3-1]|uniref:hypothetical protein n=1 Tax=Salinicola sp. MH3R3-1 TaxID=1928762 RepID=UPI001438CBD7|nr:hypothetical protein [Salinicola sp. MH3R3-1]